MYQSSTWTCRLDPNVDERCRDKRCEEHPLLLCITSFHAWCKYPASSSELLTNRNSSAVCSCCLCATACVCVRGRALWNTVFNQTQTKSERRRSNLSSAGPPGQHLLLFSSGRDNLFTSGFIALEGHLPPQRPNSLNSSCRHKVLQASCNRPPSLIVWLKLAIKMWRQSESIQTK